MKTASAHSSANFRFRFVAVLMIAAIVAATPGSAGEITGPAGSATLETAGTLDVLGTPRNYILRLPAGHADRPLPAVFILHGNSGTPSQIRGYFPFEAAADREGFAAVYPEGLERSWNDVRFADQGAQQQLKSAADVAFLNLLADELISKGIADPKRLYLTGVSNGGFMVMTMACLSPKHFAAFAVVVASAPLVAREMCKPDRPLPLLVMNGTGDPLLQWDQKRANSIGYMGGEEFFGFWSALNGCGGLEENPFAGTGGADKSSIRLVRATSCRPGGNTELYRVEGGGHHPPTLEPRPPSTFMGPRNHDIEAGEVIWSFLKKFSR